MCSSTPASPSPSTAAASSGTLPVSAGRPRRRPPWPRRAGHRSQRRSGTRYGDRAGRAWRGRRAAVPGCRAGERARGRRVDLEDLDFSELESIRDFAGRWRRRRVDVLVHNAGVLPSERLQTADGSEFTLATHLVGPFLLTHLLAPRLGEREAGSSSSSRGDVHAAPGPERRRLARADLRWRGGLRPDQARPGGALGAAGDPTGAPLQGSKAGPSGRRGAPPATTGRRSAGLRRRRGRAA